MDRGTPPIEEALSGNLPTGDRTDPNARDRAAPQRGKVLKLGRAFVRTIRHFWPEFNASLQQLPDSRFQPFVRYDKKFLAWWGILLFCFKLGSRRQLDYELRDAELQVLANANHLAGTEQDTLPVHKTLNHFLGHVGPAALAKLRTQCVRRLIRMKALDACRLLGRFVVALDGTGFLCFRKLHCESCLTHRYGKTTLYLHPVLEAKLVDPRGLALSVGSEFIENPAPTNSAALSEYETVKQDCELKAFKRLAPNLKRDFPQTRLCISGDSLFACGPAIGLCEHYQWSYVLTFKPGRTSDLWNEFQALLKISPENTRRITRPDGTQQSYRWVNDLCYLDSNNQSHHFDAIILEEKTHSLTSTFAWITDFSVTARNVAEIAEKGGRVRSKIENQGFNIQKNSGLNLEHAYSIHPDNMKAFYYLLQIAHIFLQLLEAGSLIKHLARAYQTTPIQLFGSLKNIARRLLECFRYFHIPEEAFDPLRAAQCQIRLDTS